MANLRWGKAKSDKLKLVIPILVEAPNDIAKSQIIVNYTKKGLIGACRS
jgi:hypothetical protein